MAQKNRKRRVLGAIFDGAANVVEVIDVEVMGRGTLVGRALLLLSDVPTVHGGVGRLLLRDGATMKTTTTTRARRRQRQGRASRESDCRAWLGLNAAPFKAGQVTDSVDISSLSGVDDQGLRESDASLNATSTSLVLSYESHWPGPRGLHTCKPTHWECNTLIEYTDVSAAIRLSY